MGVLNEIKNFFNRSTITYINGSSTNGATVISSSWQHEYALSVISNLLSNALINVKWKTYKNNEIVKGEEWYRYNYSPNKKQTSAEFYSKLAERLVKDREVLIIELSNGNLYVADSFQFADGFEQSIKENTFVNVMVDTVMLNKTFKENKNCMFIKLPKLNNIYSNIATLEYEMNELKGLVNKGAKKALGAKYSLQTNAQGKNSTDKEYIDKLQSIYTPLMEKENAVFLTLKGEALTDLTEKQRGSEVEQVLVALNNNITANNEILAKVGAVYGVPKAFLTGEYTQDDTAIWSLLMSQFIKPVLTTIQKKFTLFALEKETIINGGKIEADLDTIDYINVLSKSDAVDKLISSGAYTTNEVREKLGNEPIKDGDKRLITKNYAVADEVLKGGETNGK